MPIRISTNAGERFILAVGSRCKKHEKPSSIKPLNHNSLENNFHNSLNTSTIYIWAFEHDSECVSIAFDHNAWFFD